MRGNQLRLTFIKETLQQLQQDYEAVKKDLSVELDSPAANKLKIRLEYIARKVDELEEEEQLVMRSLNQEDVQRSLTALKATLESHSDQLKNMLTAYLNVIQQRSWQHLSEPKVPSDIIVQLAKVPKGESIYEAVEEFVAHLILITGKISLISELQKWGEQRLNQAWSEALKRVEESQVASTIAPVESALLVKINRSDEASTQSETETYYQIKAWLIRDTQHYKDIALQKAPSDHPKGISPIDIPGTTGDEVYAISVLPDQLPKLIKQFLIESGHLFEMDPELHIFLPLELMNQAVDRWHLDDGYGKPRPLGRQYKVMLRCTERVSRSYRQEKLWKQKWWHHQSSLNQPAHSAFIAGNDSDLDELYYDLDEADEPIVGLKVLTAPTCEDANNLFGVLLQVGMPVAIWGRRNLVQVTNEAELDRVLNACCLEKLPLTVKEERRLARKMAEDSHVGHHLSLLWDDPYIVPPRSV